MERIVAYCGIVCSDCPAFKATQADDDAERRRVAKQWTEQYGAEHKIEDINCDGCLSTGPRIYRHCRACEIRNCGLNRHVENCAYCEDYACGKLAKLFAEYQPAKDVLDGIRASGK
jgi:hypothetical protein